MESSTCCLPRVPANGKFWLKNAVLACGTAVDIRIEDGRIRAVIPAGEAPCCAPGLCLDGGAVCPLGLGQAIGPQQPADLLLTLANGRTVEMRGGQIAGLSGAHL